MNIAIIIATFAVAGFTSFGFVKAGMHKLRTPDAKLIEGGWGWVKSAPKGTTKFIGLAEVLGGLGVILSPVAVTVFNFDWALPLGIAAGAGLVTIMVLANLVHIVRKEIKYTWKMGVQLLVVTILVTALLSVYPTA
jgi:DoxX-like family